MSNGHTPAPRQERTTASASGSNDDLERLKIALDLRRFHHNAIWEEQKHFTWLISILLSGQVIGVSSGRLDSNAKSVLILVGSLIGALLSATAFRVQRREGQYYSDANAAFVSRWNTEFPNNKLFVPGPNPNKPIHTLITSSVIGKAGVRDYFQLLFLLFAAVFAALTIYGAVLLLA